MQRPNLPLRPKCAMFLKSLFRTKILLTCGNVSSPTQILELYERLKLKLKAVLRNVTCYLWLYCGNVIPISLATSEANINFRSCTCHVCVFSVLSAPYKYFQHLIYTGQLQDSSVDNCAHHHIHITTVVSRQYLNFAAPS